MANFQLNWTPPPGTNLQRASYRIKGTPTFNYAGFNPSNDLISTANSTSIAGLADNTVYQFKVEAICPEGAPAATSIFESIVFACNSNVVITPDDDFVSISIATTDSIKAVAHYLWAVDANGSPTTLVASSTTLVTNGTTIYTFTGLTPNTNYLYKYALVANVNGVDTVSSTECGHTVKTSVAVQSCPPVTDITLTASS